jgi:hypothetical protein
LLKAFTFFEPAIVRVVLQLMNTFRRVVCAKPASSKPGNSEVLNRDQVCFYRPKTIFELGNVKGTGVSPDNCGGAIRCPPTSSPSTIPVLPPGNDHGSFICKEKFFYIINLFKNSS